MTTITTKKICQATLAVCSFLGIASSAFAVDPLAGLPAPVAAIHKGLIDSKQCTSDLTYPSSSSDLGKGNTLYLVPCIMGAYQGSAKGYIVWDNGSFIQQVAVLSHVNGSIVASLDLSEAYFDAKSMTLSTHAKGRGLGDCGESSQSKISFDKYGTLMIKTVEIRSKPACDGKDTSWPIVYTQK